MPNSCVGTLYVPVFTTIYTFQKKKSQRKETKKVSRCPEKWTNNRNTDLTLSSINLVTSRVLVLLQQGSIFLNRYVFACALYSFHLPYYNNFAQLTYDVKVVTTKCDITLIPNLEYNVFPRYQVGCVFKWPTPDIVITSLEVCLYVTSPSPCFIAERAVDRQNILPSQRHRHHRNNYDLWQRFFFTYSGTLMLRVYRP